MGEQRQVPGTSVILLGGGGHGAVVADLLLAAGRQIIGVADPALDPVQVWRFGLSVLGNDEIVADYKCHQVVLANGLGFLPGQTQRREIYQRYYAQEYQFVGFKHASAVISRFATIADDAQIMANVTIQCDANIGANTIINTGAVIEHDVQVAAHSHIAPGAVVCGNAIIEEHCFVGAGAVVVQGSRLAAGRWVKAGSVYYE